MDQRGHFRESRRVEALPRRNLLCGLGVRRTAGGFGGPYFLLDDVAVVDNRFRFLLDGINDAESHEERKGDGIHWQP